MRLADATDAAHAGVPAELAVTVVDIACACEEGLMVVAVEAALATALALMSDEGAFVQFVERPGGRRVL